MTDQNSPFFNQNRPPGPPYGGPMYPNYGPGANAPAPQPLIPEQPWKAPLSSLGGMNAIGTPPHTAAGFHPPGPSMGGQPSVSVPSGVNGFSTPMTQPQVQAPPGGNLQTMPSGSLGGIRHPSTGTPNFMMNGPHTVSGDGPQVRPPVMGPPRMGPPTSLGQFRPTQSSTGPPQGGLSSQIRPRGPLPPPPRGVQPPPMPGSPRTGPGTPPTSTPGLPGSPYKGQVPTVNTPEPQTSDVRPNDLPIPYHGQGQYSHQVGMSLTPGITPGNSEPTSQRSSRSSSPVVNQNFDALEGQFTGEPTIMEQIGASQPPRSVGTPVAPPPAQDMGQRTEVTAPAYSTTSNFPGSPATGQWSNTSVTSPSQHGPQGQTHFQQPGFPPSQQPGGVNQPPRFPAPSTQQRFGAPPSSVGQHQGFTPSVSTPPQQPGFPPFPPTSAGQQPPGARPPMSVPSQRPGFPPPQSTQQQPGFPAMPSQQRPGFPPPPTTIQQPGFPPTSTNQRPGFPPPPSNQMTGFPPTTANQQPQFPLPPSSQQTDFPQHGGFVSSVPNQQPGFPPPLPNQGQGQFLQQEPPSLQAGYKGGMNALSSNFSGMNVQDGQPVVNLLQTKLLIPAEGVETPKPNLMTDYKKANISPDIFRCTLSSIPQTSSLLNKARLPLGILIHPFRDLSQLPVIQSSVIVRCRSCRTYINPFVYFVDTRKWKCNLCYRVNELPDEFSFDPVSKTYGEPQRRPEIRSATIEFIAPSEYMLRPPQPACYIYLLDVSFNAIETGYLNVFCSTMLDVLDKIPGDGRTQVGFIAYDKAVHFFNLAEGLSQPQMLTVGDIDDIFLPCPDDLLVNLSESKELVIDLLNQLPELFDGNMETGSALGAALQAAHKLVGPIGGRVTVMQTLLPSAGPGALHNREADYKKDVANLGPATDFYKKLALECSAQQVAVDLFMLNGQYADIASLACISKYSGGCVQYYPSFHNVRNPSLSERFEVDLRRYLTRKIGFESVMRIRCTKGLSIHTFHGNFFVRSTDLLSLPNVNPDAGFGMQMSIEDSLTETSTVCFQAALLYTSSKAERRIRVHTMCLPVVSQLSDVYAGADQQAIVALLAKMAADRSVSSSLSDAREALINAAVDVVTAYSSQVTSAQRIGTLPICHSLRLIPTYVLAMLKSVAFRASVTKADDRVYALEQCKTLPLCYLIQSFYPNLYPVHTILEQDVINKGSLEVPNLRLLHLSSANIDRFGSYLMDTGESMYLYVGSAISEQFCKDVLDKPNFMSVEDGLTDLPELENEASKRLRNFLTYILDCRPNGASFHVVREDGKMRMKFFQHMVEDRTEGSMSYYEFLQQLQKHIKS